MIYPGRAVALLSCPRVEPGLADQSSHQLETAIPSPPPCPPPLPPYHEVNKVLAVPAVTRQSPLDRHRTRRGAALAVPQPLSLHRSGRGRGGGLAPSFTTPLGGADALLPLQVVQPVAGAAVQDRAALLKRALDLHKEGDQQRGSYSEDAMQMQLRKWEGTPWRGSIARSEAEKVGGAAGAAGQL